MDALLMDLRYALRALRRSPGFAAVVILTLALGIGANTAIFSVVNGVLLTPLPYAHPDRLVVVWESKGRNTDNVVNPANYMDWRDRATSFSGLASFHWTGMVFTGDQPENVAGRAVTTNFFDVVGVAPRLGRAFTEQESHDSATAIILSDGLWRSRFGADSTIVGKSVPVAGGVARVIGVMPASFRPLPLSHEEYWEPMRLPADHARHGRYAMVVGRLKDGVTLERAQAEMVTITGQLATEYPDFDTGWSATVTPLMEQVVGASQRLILVVLGAVCLVLLIACANIANLMLARAATRARETAVRTALGAPRWRLTRQRLAESVLLAFVGGGAGLLIAGWGIDLLVSAAPAEVPRVADIHIDARVFAFTALVSLLAGVLFGLPAALFHPDADLAQLHSATTRTTSGPAARQLRGALVVAQMALAIVLLAGAGLLVRSLRELVAVNPGFDPASLSALSIELPHAVYPDSGRQVVFFDRLMERVRAMPGVLEAGLISWLPMTSGNAATGFTVLGRPAPAPGQRPTTAVRIVDPGYFGAMRIPLKRGRLIAATDRLGAVPVTVVSEAFVRKHFRGEDVLGKQVKVQWWHPDLAVQIVGVVGDVHHDGLDSELWPTLYFPFAQEPQGGMNVVMRSGLEPAALTRMVRAAVRELDSGQPVGEAATMYHRIGEMMADRRYAASLLGAFAALALALAAVGIYGVHSYTVGQRIHEIGVRMALGAQPADVRRDVLGGALALALGGVALGSLAALFATRALGKLLFNVPPADPLTFTSVAVLLVCVALLACWLPARRAARTDPMVALRSE